MERLLLDGVPQSVVIQLNVQRFGGATIDDARGATGDAETAARTRALLSALKSDKFHNLLQKESTATSVTPV
jgi:hypothetical protein